MFIRIGGALLAPASIFYDIVVLNSDPGTFCYIGCAFTILGFIILNIPWKYKKMRMETKASVAHLLKVTLFVFIYQSIQVNPPPLTSWGGGGGWSDSDPRFYRFRPFPQRRGSGKYGEGVTLIDWYL